jgi:DNA polymerase III subunit beta
LNLTISRATLTDLLSTVSPAVARRGSLPILSGVRIGADNGRLTIEATNLDQTIYTSAAATVEDPGAVVAPFALLSSLLSSLIGDSVTLASEKGNRIRVVCGRNQTTLSGYSPDEWPTPAAPSGATLSLPGAIIAEGIAATSYAIAGDESRPALTGLLVDVTDDAITLAAADGYRLATWQHEVDAPACRAIVPGVVLKSVAKLARTETVDVTLGAGRAKFAAGGTRVETRLIEGQFPNYSQIIPTGATTTVVAASAELARVVRSVLTVGKANASIIKVTVETDRLVLSSTSEEGTSEDEVVAAVTGEPLAFAVNGVYFGEALASIAGDVSIGLTTPQRPILMRPNAGTDQTAVVMPMAIVNGRKAVPR